MPFALVRSLRIARTRSAWSRAEKNAPMQETIHRIVQVLDRLGVQWCLIGAHAVGEYTVPRATEDVDLLIDDRRMPKILSELETQLGDLDADDIGPAVRLRVAAVDLVRASSNAVFRATLKDAVTIGQWRFPAREALIVMKFMAATSPFRGLDRRRQDMVDLIALYRSVDPGDLDRARLTELASTIHTGAAEELLELLAKVDADEPILI